MSEPAQPTERRKTWDAIQRYSALGIEIGVAAFIGFFIGAFLDRRLHTAPWLTLVFLLLGIFAGFRDLYRAAMKYQREQEQEDAASKGTEAGASAKDLDDHDKPGDSPGKTPGPGH
jgi:ATP synthase protein I